MLGGPLRNSRGTFGIDLRIASSISSTHVSRRFGCARGDQIWTMVLLRDSGLVIRSSLVGLIGSWGTATIGDVNLGVPGLGGPDLPLMVTFNDHAERPAT